MVTKENWKRGTQGELGSNSELCKIWLFCISVPRSMLIMTLKYLIGLLTEMYDLNHHTGEREGYTYDRTILGQFSSAHCDMSITFTLITLSSMGSSASQMILNNSDQSIFVDGGMEVQSSAGQISYERLC